MRTVIQSGGNVDVPGSINSALTKFSMCHFVGIEKMKSDLRPDARRSVGVRDKPHDVTCSRFISLDYDGYLMHAM